MPLFMPPQSRIIAQSAAQLTLTGGVANTETVIATITIPAGALGPNGRIRSTVLWGCNNNGNTKRFRQRFNGLAGTIYSSQDVTTSTCFRSQIEIANRNALNSQVGAPNSIAAAFGTSAGSLVTSAIDTSAAVDLVLTGTLVTANTDTITIESYLVELLGG